MVLLIVVIFVVWVLLDRVRYNRYRRRYIVGTPVSVVRPVYYPIFWGRHMRPRPPRQPRAPYGGGPRPPVGGYQPPRSGGSGFGGGSRGGRGGFGGGGFGGGRR